MLPSIAASSSGHWNQEGSRRWQRAIFPASSLSQTSTSPRNPSTRAMPSPDPSPGRAGPAWNGPAGKPSSDRARHLAEVHVPMLFMQGTRDKLAELTLLEPVIASLGPSASLHLVREADHSFHVLARSGRNDREVMNEILDAFAGWIGAIAAT